jgi:thiol-disulfide isomerase/thioredoxin
MNIKAVLVALLCLLSAAVPGAGDHPVGLDSGDEISVARYKADGGDSLLLWLPSEFGLSPRQVPTAEALAKRGIETWIADLHSAWFLPTGRYSLNDVDPNAIRQLIEAAALGGRDLYLMAPGRTAALALRALRQYQQQHQDTQAVRGLISIGPRLFLRTPQGGEAEEFLPIASASNVPVYILQPRDTGGFWRVGKLAQMLEHGGAPVFIQILNEARDGFNLRREFTPHEKLLTERLPGILQQAMRQLAAYGGLPSEPAPMPSEDRAPEADRGSELLRPYPGNAAAPDLRLPSLNEASKRLDSLQGKVVLVNFWATWCPPCVEEIPSLQRLYQKRRTQGLEILAVAVGEDKQQVTDFLANKPVGFPVLLDTDGRQFKRWGVHAFPTTFVLDRSHHIRYAGFGAFAWDNREVLDVLDGLLAE